MLKRFATSAGIGGVATGVSYGLLLFGVEILGLSHSAANAASLIAGSLVNFLGNRIWTFKATGGRLHRQAPLYVLVEVGGFFLNVAVFEAFVRLDLLHYAVARLVGTLLVFACYNYPMWHWVFKSPTGRS